MATKLNPLMATKMFIVSFERARDSKTMYRSPLQIKFFTSVLLREIFSSRSTNCPPSWINFKPHYQCFGDVTSGVDHSKLPLNTYQQSNIV